MGNSPENQELATLSLRMPSPRIDRSLPSLRARRCLVSAIITPEWCAARAVPTALPGEGQVGSAPMGSLLILVFVTEGLFGYSR